LDKPKHKFWVGVDGSYGFGVQTFNTDNWSEKDFDRIEMASDTDRLIIAQAVDAKRKKERMMARRFIESVETMEVRHFYIDEDGITELDPETGEEL
jgi:hypothetical protein